MMAKITSWITIVKFVAPALVVLTILIFAFGPKWKDLEAETLTTGRSGKSQITADESVAKGAGGIRIRIEARSSYNPTGSVGGVEIDELKIAGIVLIRNAKIVSDAPKWCDFSEFSDKTEPPTGFETFSANVVCEISDLNSEFITVDARSHNIGSGTEISKDDGEERPAMTLRIFERVSVVERIAELVE